MANKDKVELSKAKPYAFPNNIRMVREHKGFSVEQIASKLDVTASYLKEVEKGICKPDAYTLYQICTALSCGISELYLSGTNNLLSWIDWEARIRVQQAYKEKLGVDQISKALKYIRENICKKDGKNFARVSGISNNVLKDLENGDLSLNKINSERYRLYLKLDSLEAWYEYLNKVIEENSFGEKIDFSDREKGSQYEKLEKKIWKETYNEFAEYFGLNTLFNDRYYIFRYILIIKLKDFTQEIGTYMSGTPISIGEVIYHDGKTYKISEVHHMLDDVAKHNRTTVLVVEPLEDDAMTKKLVKIVDISENNCLCVIPNSLEANNDKVAEDGKNLRNTKFV